MTNKVLILGGYGNFGKRIAMALIQHNVSIIIAGRHREKAESLLKMLNTSLATMAIFDVTQDLSEQIKILCPAIIINACGPFQTSNYNVARICIMCGVHYIDLADGRDFVSGISILNREAEQRGITIISGASTVPGLSSAVIEHYCHEFTEIDSLIFGITPGQKSERGFATTQSILSYVGRPLKPFSGATKPVYGWQNIYRQTYPELGKRWMANCDIPDLDLLPARYAIRSIRFSAGLELGFMHLGLWMLSWLIRFGLPIQLPRYAAFLLSMSNKFNRFGTAHGGMHMILRGKDREGYPYERYWFILAKDGDGPQIPCVPAIILARKFIAGERIQAGAYPCIGIISLEEYLSELRNFNIVTISDGQKCNL